MNPPELRRPGNTHHDPRYVQIEELFWMNKPITTYTYEENGYALSGQKPAPEINRKIVRSVWGEDERDRLIPASHIAHLTIFSIPAFIDVLDARSPNVRASRYGEFNFENEISTFWTGHAFALAIGRGTPQPEQLRVNLGLFHTSSRSHRHFDPSYVPARGEYIGVPESSLAMSVYETVRIGEELAMRLGIAVTDEIRDVQYAYFRQIAYDGGIWMPETRHEMEQIGSALDETAVLNSSTLELTERMVRRSILTIPGISLDTVRATLRPNAASIVTEVCGKFGYFSD